METPFSIVRSRSRPLSMIWKHLFRSYDRVLYRTRWYGNTCFDRTIAISTVLDDMETPVSIVRSRSRPLSMIWKHLFRSYDRVLYRTRWYGNTFFERTIAFSTVLDDMETPVSIVRSRSRPFSMIWKHPFRSYDRVLYRSRWYGNTFFDRTIAISTVLDDMETRTFFDRTIAFSTVFDDMETPFSIVRSRSLPYSIIWKHLFRSYDRVFCRFRWYGNTCIDRTITFSTVLDNMETPFSIVRSRSLPYLMIWKHLFRSYDRVL